MAAKQTQANRFRWRACMVFGSMLIATMVYPPQHGSEPWAAPVERSSARSECEETDKNEVYLPLVLDDAFGAILLLIEVNGRPAQVILDTGSNVTVLSPDIAPQTHLEPSYPVTPLKRSGYVSTGHWGEANIHIGDRYWINRRILVDEMRSVSQAHKERIDGILGRDILREFRFVTINYERKVLTFGSR